MEVLGKYALDELFHALDSDGPHAIDGFALFGSGTEYRINAQLGSFTQPLRHAWYGPDFTAQTNFSAERHAFGNGNVGIG